MKLVRLAGCLPLLALAACGKTAIATPPKPPVPVETAVAELRDMPRQLRAIGTVAAAELVTVRPQVSATLATVGFSEGSMVAAGAPLFTLDDRAFAANERQTAAEAERAKAQLALARADAARMADLVRQNLATAQQGEQAQANLAVMQAAAAAAEAALARVRLELSWCTIRAPIAGRTGALGITPGNLAAAGQTALVTIARLQPIHVGFSVPATALPAIQAAMSRGQVAVSATPEGGGAPEAGVLDLLDNQIDPNTASLRLRAVYPNAANRLWPGQQCQVELALGTDAQVVTVPERAVQTGQRGSIVWTVSAERTVMPQVVVVDRISDGRAILASGIKAGEVVVSDGQLRLSKGATVAPPAPAEAKPERGAGAR